MKKETIIKSLFNWFADCEVLNSDNELNVDYLDEEPENYCLEVVPCNPIIKSYVDGSAKRALLFGYKIKYSYRLKSISKEIGFFYLAKSD